MDIRFYYIKNDYIDFLKKYEKEQVGHTCVPNIQYKTSDKFVFGAVMDINGMDYFVPVSSFSKYKEDVILMRDKNNKSDILGSLRFAYMLPVPRPCLIKLDINSVTNSYSKTHISKELAFCRREREKIFKQAEQTYHRVISKVNEQLVKNSCDFKLLEQAYIEYCIENKIKCPQISNQDNALKKLNEVYTDFLNNTKIDNNVHNNFVTQHGELPQTLDTAENRGNVSKYIVEQLDKGDITETQQKTLKSLKQAITDFEEPLFADKVNVIAEWSSEVIEKADERSTGHNEQEKNNNVR